MYVQVILMYELQVILIYVLTELGYVLICQVKEKEKKCSFENALVEKSTAQQEIKMDYSKVVIIFNVNV